MSTLARGHLRLVHSSDADVIPLPRTATAYEQVVHIVLRLIPQQAITKRSGHIAVNGYTAEPAVRVGLAAAVRAGLAEWSAYDNTASTVRLTETGVAALHAWNQAHPANTTGTSPGPGDVA